MSAPNLNPDLPDGFTVDLTAGEKAFKRGLTPSGELQAGTIAASLRTGKRIGTKVGYGLFTVVLVAYQLRKGRPHGRSRIIDLSGDLHEEEAVNFLKALG